MLTSETMAAVRFSCVSTSKPITQSRRDQHPCRVDGHAPARERPKAGALDLPVEIAVDDVIVDAARAAHRKGTEEQPQEQVPPPADARQRNAPGARPIEQPRPDRPVEPHQRRVGPQPRRKCADKAAPLAVGDDVAFNPSPLMGEGWGGGEVRHNARSTRDITPPQPLPIEGRGFVATAKPF